MFEQDTRIQVGRTLRLAAQTRGITQAQLAEHMAIDRGIVSRVWRGKVKKPRHYITMASVLGVEHPELERVRALFSGSSAQQATAGAQGRGDQTMAALHTDTASRSAHRERRRTGPARVLAVASEKGGVAKTTTAINLAAVWASSGERVLLIDLDAQGSATSHLGLEREGANLLGALAREDTLRPVPTTHGLDLIPGGRALANATAVCMSQKVPSGCLKGAIRSVRDDYDLIIIDTPPSLGIVSVNALMSATHVLVPVQLEVGALEGLAQVFETIEDVQEYNEDLHLMGTVPVMVDERTTLTREAMAVVRHTPQAKTTDAIIHRNVAVAESWGQHKPVVRYDTRSRGAREYIALAMELEGRWS
ncbi:MAG: AAA family ATPase [Myxococcota bacterium]